jgi:hypothetical protein
MRQAISSQEEAWVKACYRFFETHGMWDWYTVDRDQAVAEIMKNSGGTLNPVWVKNKIDELYESVGVK